MTAVSEIADYLAFDPDGLGMDPDETGLPALIGGAKRKWPAATNAEIGEAARMGAERAKQRAAAFFAEADALDALRQAKRRSALGVIEGGKR